MTMQPNPLTLAEQAEAAPPERTRELLIEAWRHLRGGMSIELCFDHYDPAYRAFARLLDINTQEAFLGAVMMLKPEGARVEFIEMEDGRGAARLLWPGEARLQKLEPLYATPALALLAAIMRAAGERG